MSMTLLSPVFKLVRSRPLPYVPVRPLPGHAGNSDRTQAQMPASAPPLAQRPDTRRR